jgi:hypothetical protein
VLAVALLVGATTVFAEVYPPELAGDEFVGELDVQMYVTPDTDYSSLPIGIGGGGDISGALWYFGKARSLAAQTFELEFKYKASRVWVEFPFSSRSGDGDYCAGGSEPARGHPPYRLTWYEDAGAYLALVRSAEGAPQFTAFTWSDAEQVGYLRVGTLVQNENEEWSISLSHTLAVFEVTEKTVTPCMRRGGKRHK